MKMSELEKFLVKIGFQKYFGEFQAAKIHDLATLKLIVNETRLLEKVVEIEGHREILLAKLKEYCKEPVLTVSSHSQAERADQNRDIDASNDQSVGFEFEMVVVEDGQLNFHTRSPDSHKSPPRKKSKLASELLEFLDSRAEGKYLRALHQKKGFDNKGRLRLAALIIDNEYGANTNTVISVRRFQEIAQSICEAFDGEIVDSYYIPAYTPRGGKTILAKGKLYDKYTSFNKDLRETGLRKLRPRRTYTEVDAVEMIPVSNTVDLEASLKFLRTNLKPWTSVTHHWEATTNFRLNALLNEDSATTNVGEYFKLYPCLTLADGYTLLEHDFNTRYSEASLRLYSHWGLFCGNVAKELKKAGLKADGDVDLLQKFIQLFSIVPVKTNKKPWRANRLDILKGFLYIVPRDADFEKEVAELKEQAREKGVILQPFPLLVGPSPQQIDASYIVIDGRPILVETPLRAFEVAFKCFFALNCKYPVQSERPWIVIQKTLFNLHVPNDRENPVANQPEVRRLIKSLEC